uniref:NADH-ubiquinone oxidoreductase chain 2 n=1 Tax=Trachinops taeniatus TaxID=1040957 RepID=I1T2G3_9TELE|nr:NADH dehydrogenase subunit 2 [Trachinops taeniatus]AEK53185.1 NADH dehydrogenase subunit 2 [Trachinops taeniatus]
MYLYKNPYILCYLFSCVGLGTTITFASSHWLLAWMGLEMNTLAFVPLMVKDPMGRAMEAAAKYFFTQAGAAALLLFSAVLNALISGQWDIHQMDHPVPVTLFVLAMALKLGIPPGHAWLTEVMQGLTLMMGMALSTWQKLAPFVLLIQIQPSNQVILLALGLISIVVGGLGGLNQAQLRKMMAYSSIAHLGWALVVLQFSVVLSILALITYMMTSSALFIMFTFTKSLNMNALATAWTKNPPLAALLLLILLSLGGIPPLMGFMPKWLIIQELIQQGFIVLASLAAMSALLSLFFYVRIAYAASLTISPNNLSGTAPWRLPTTNHALLLAPLSALTLAALPLTPTVMTLLP